MKNYAGTIVRFLCLLALGLLPSVVGAVDFQSARPGYSWSFPRDHGSHPNYWTEWWYFTGVLTTADREFGYQFTVFRSAIDRAPAPGSAWATNQVYMGHFALSDPAEESHRGFLRTARGHPRLAGADTTVPGRVFVRDWSLQLGDTWVIEAGHGGTELSLTLSPTRPPLFQGPGGYSRKGSGPSQASMYYSLTRMKTRGQLKKGGSTHSVKGTTWFDHEFGSNELSDQQTGWDWISLRLDNGYDLMVYRLREEGGKITRHSSVTLRGPGGKVQYIPASEWSMEPLDHWKSPETGGRYPVKWRLSIDDPDVSLVVDRWFNAQEMVLEGALNRPYWEGMVFAEGRFRGEPVSGDGYLEMTGYMAPLEGSF
jgi:predicted secreted hydrolase